MPPPMMRIYAYSVRIHKQEPATEPERLRLPVDPESSPAGGVQVVEVEPVRPVALVVLRREVAGARAGDERFTNGAGVGLVAGTPGGRRDVHDVAPAALALHRRDGVD